MKIDDVPGLRPDSWERQPRPPLPINHIVKGLHGALQLHSCPQPRTHLRTTAYGDCRLPSLCHPSALLSAGQQVRLGIWALSQRAMFEERRRSFFKYTRRGGVNCRHGLMDYELMLIYHGGRKDDSRCTHFPQTFRYCRPSLSLRI